LLQISSAHPDPKTAVTVATEAVGDLGAVQIEVVKLAPETSSERQLAKEIEQLTGGRLQVIEAAD
jgi:hypothetical protein